MCNKILIIPVREYSSYPRCKFSHWTLILQLVWCIVSYVVMSRQMLLCLVRLLFVLCIKIEPTRTNVTSSHLSIHIIYGVLHIKYSSTVLWFAHGCSCFVHVLHMNTASISSLYCWCDGRQIRNRQTVANNDCGAFCAVDKRRPFRLALVLCRALQPVDKGGLFGVKQARNCERGV